MDMIRSIKVNEDTLDSKLVELQECGCYVSQVIPCPKSIVDTITEDHQHCAVSMEFMIIYKEYEKALQ